MIINGIKVPHTNMIESFSVRYINDGTAALVRVRFHNGSKRVAEFVGESETMCGAIALGVNAIIAYAESKGLGVTK